MDGFEALPKKLSEWKGRIISYDGFSSSCIIKNASYISNQDKDVQMVIIKPRDMPGAAYIEEISYNKAHGFKNEYEVLLQNNQEYAIIEAQIFKGKYIIVVEAR